MLIIWTGAIFVLGMFCGNFLALWRGADEEE